MLRDSPGRDRPAPVGGGPVNIADLYGQLWLKEHTLCEGGPEPHLDRLPVALVKGLNQEKCYPGWAWCESSHLFIHEILGEMTAKWHVPIGRSASLPTTPPVGISNCEHNRIFVRCRTLPSRHYMGGTSIVRLIQVVT